jgi:integrase
MTKLTLPTNARIVKQTNSDWYIVWYYGGKRERYKFGLNRIKDLQERQRWADKIVQVINKANFNDQSLSREEVEDLVKHATFNAFMDDYLELRENTLTLNSRKSIRVHRNNWNRFAKDVLKKDEIDFEDFNLSFPLRYQDWCYQPPRSWSRNYCSKSFQLVRMILNDALEQGAITSQAHRSKKYSLSQTETDDIALDMPRIQKLMAIKAFPRPALKVVRDGFVFACMTGLRYGDFANLTIENFGKISSKDGDIRVIRVVTQKTGEKVVVPLHPIALAVVNDYEAGCFPKMPCNQVFNRYLKEVCEVAGLVEPVVIRENVAGKFVSRTYKMYEAVSAHTARRSFATIAYFLKVPPVLIMKITGHKTEREFFKYIKITKEEAAVEMAGYFGEEEEYLN